MTPTATPSKGSARQRLLAVAILAILIVVGIRWFVKHSGETGVEPPPVPENGLESEVINALRTIREQVEQHPESGEKWGEYGQCFLANGLPAEAAICLKRAETLDRENPRWPFYLASATSETEPEQSLECLRRAVEKCDRSDPNNPAPRLQLAAKLIERGDFREAEELLRRVREVEIADAHCLYLTALLFARQDDARGSVALLRFLTEHPSARRKVAEKLSQIYSRLGEASSANRWERLARSLPEDAPWQDRFRSELLQYAVRKQDRFEEIEALIREGRDGDAIARIASAIRNDEFADKNLFSLLGKCLVRLGKGEEAERAFEESVRRFPNDAEQYHLLAVVRLLQGEVRKNQHGDQAGAIASFERGLASVGEAIRIKPEFAEAFATRGQLLVLLDRRAEGVAAFRESIKLQPESSGVEMMLGNALAEGGEYAEARVHLRNAVRFAVETDDRPSAALAEFYKKYASRLAPQTPKRP